MEHQLILQSTIIKNFRLFRDLSVDFNEELTVIISENGAGKTSLIDCIAGHLAYKLNELTDFIAIKHLTPLSSKAHNFFPNYQQDVNKQAVNNNEAFSNRLSYKGHYIDFDEGSSAKETSGKIVSEITFENKKHEEIRTDFSEELIEGDINKYEKLTNSIEYCINEGIPYSIPVLVYYPCAFSDIKETESVADPSLKFSAWERALTGNPFNRKEFNEWFKWRYNLYLLKKEENKEFETVLNALLNFLNANNNGNINIYQDIFMDYSYFPGEVVIQKQEETFTFSQLSSGEKTLLILVADLARRLSIANPHADNPLNGQGIVLIDEIDLHLHPKWQRKVIHSLKNTFPNIQFIITTHSPLVLSNVNKNNIVILKDDDVFYPTSDTLGRTVNEILEEVMVTDKSPVEEFKEKYFRLIMDDMLDEAQAEKQKAIDNELITKNNSIFKKADAYIQRRKLLKK